MEAAEHPLLYLTITPSIHHLPPSRHSFLQLNIKEGQTGQINLENLKLFYKKKMRTASQQEGRVNKIIGAYKIA